MVPTLVLLFAFLLTFAFPRGIRITLGRRALWLAPPAVPIYSYFRIAAQYQKTGAEWRTILATLRDIHVNCDRMLADLSEDFPELVATGRIEVRRDPIIRIMVWLLAGVETNARLHFDAFQKHADRTDDLLAQPVARTISDLLIQDVDLQTTMRLALLATSLRVSTFDADILTVKRVLQPLKDQALQLDSRQTALDEISAALQTLGDQVDDLGDEIAQVTQPGRRRAGRPTKWTQEKTQELYAAYLTWDGTYNEEFFHQHGLKNRTQMYELFDRYGLRRKPGELTDN